MSVITLAVLCVVNRLKRITHVMFGFLILLNGCNDSEAPLGNADNISHGAGDKPVIDLSDIIERTTLKSTYVYTLTGGHCPLRHCSDN